MIYNTISMYVANNKEGKTYDESYHEKESE